MKLLKCDCGKTKEDQTSPAEGQLDLATSQPGDFMELDYKVNG